MPELDTRNSEVDRPRVLAVLAEPPEVRPGARVDFVALVVSPEGRVEHAALGWTWCVTPKPLVGNGFVSPECRFEPGLPLDEQDGDAASGILPLDACSRFGPDPPPGDARPRDADATGGFYQPLRLDALGQVFIHRQRILCNPKNAPADVAREYAREYTTNRNPAIASLSFERGGARLSAARVARGTRLDVALRSTTDAAEGYVWIEPIDARLEPRREVLRASWFATAGQLEIDASPAAEADGVLDAHDRWLAPNSAGRATLWAILRDDRGGAAFVERNIEVF